jgi:MraZ protein
MARRFRGESTHKVDAKGRVSIPAPFRRVLEEGDPDWTDGLQPQLVIVYGRPGKKCLEGFTIRAMEEIDEKISRMPRFSPKREALERLINTKSVYVSVDDTGRIVLSQKLREMVGVTDEAVFAGMGDHFQIWEAGALAEDQAALEAKWADEAGDVDPFTFLDEMPDAGE